MSEIGSEFAKRMEKRRNRNVGGAVGGMFDFGYVRQFFGLCSTMLE